MEKCICAKFLCARAEAPEHILGAYFSALLPLATVYTLDFITEKWKTIAATRREGRLHLFFSLICLPYLIYFIHLQRCIKNYTEMGAAITAMLLSCFHMGRTVWGLVQLEAFKKWNVHALHTLTRVGYPAPVDGDRREIGPDLTRSECAEAIDEYMVVNCTLIDNAFFGTEVPIRVHLLSCKNLHFKLYSTAPVECSVRWMVSFLSRFGSIWLLQNDGPGLDYGLGNQMGLLVGVLASLHVTRVVDHQYASLLPLDHRFFRHPEYIWDTCYRKTEGRSALPFEMRNFDDSEVVDFHDWETSIQNAIFSWDRKSVHLLPVAERSAPSKITSQHIVCFANLMDCKDVGAANFEFLQDGDEAVSSYGAVYYMRLIRLVLQLGFKNAAQRNIDSFLSRLPIRGPILSQSSFGDCWRVPEGSFAMFSAVSVHVDNFLALEAGDVLVRHEHQFSDTNLNMFDSQMHVQSTLFAASNVCSNSTFLGVTVEILRSIITSATLDTVNWKTSLQQGGSSVRIRISEQLISAVVLLSCGIRHEMRRNTHMRLLFELQSGVLTLLQGFFNNSTVSTLCGMPVSMLLMILGFPALIVRDAHDLGLTASDIDEPYVIPMRIDAILAPQKATYILVKLNQKEKHADVELRGTDTFDWYLWQSAIVARMHTSWSLRKEERPHRDVSSFVTNRSSPSVLPWPSFFDLGFDFERSKASLSSPTENKMFFHVPRSPRSPDRHQTRTLGVTEKVSGPAWSPLSLPPSTDIHVMGRSSPPRTSDLSR